MNPGVYLCARRFGVWFHVNPRQVVGKPNRSGGNNCIPKQFRAYHSDVLVLNTFRMLRVHASREWSYTLGRFVSSSCGPSTFIYLLACPLWSMVRYNQEVRTRPELPRQPRHRYYVVVLDRSTSSYYASVVVGFNLGFELLLGLSITKYCLLLARSNRSVRALIKICASDGASQHYRGEFFEKKGSSNLSNCNLQFDMFGFLKHHHRKQAQQSGIQEQRIPIKIAADCDDPPLPRPTLLPYCRVFFLS